MLTVEKLKQKGFERIVYAEQAGNPTFYGRRFDNLDDVIKIHQFLGESSGDLEFNYDGLFCHIEIEENLSKGQYLFSEINLDTGYVAHDPLTVEQFEKLVDII